MLTLLLAAAASAGVVEDGLQAAVFPGAFSFAESRLSGMSFDLFEDELGGRYDCWDELGVQDFNLQIPIRDVSLSLDGDALSVVVDFGDIYGRDMTVYGLDSDTFDTCPEFETQLTYAELTDARVSLALVPRVSGGVLSLELEAPPTLTGDLDTDFEDLPDDLVLYFFEETIFEIAEEELGAVLPPLTAEYLAEPVILGQQYGDFDVDLGLDRADVSSRSLRMAANTDLAWRGSDGCPTSDRPDGSPGLSPTLDFGDGEGSSLGVGVTEGMVNEMFLSAWRGGYFCFTEENVAEFLSLAGDSFDPGVAGLGGTVWLGAAPRVSIDGRGVGLELAGLGLRAFGEVGGQREELLYLEADIRGLLELGIDQDASAFVLSLAELELDVHALESDHLLEDNGESSANLEQLLEEWAAGWAADQAQDITLFSTLYSAFGTVIRVDRLDYAEGGLKVFASLFDEDDPAVDTAPPDTRFALLESTPTSALLGLSGSDNRQGALAYAVQVNGAGWSAWSADTEVLLDDLSPGVYEIEVRSRDAWLNVDPEPAIGWLEVTGGDDPVRGCGCAAGGAGGLAPLSLSLLGLLAIRRRDPSG